MQSLRIGQLFLFFQKFGGGEERCKMKAGKGKYAMGCKWEYLGLQIPYQHFIRLICTTLRRLEKIIFGTLHRNKPVLYLLMLSSEGWMTGC